MADDFDLGLVIRADGSQAVAAGDEYAGSMDRVAASTKRADDASKSATTTTTAGAGANKQAATAANDHAIAQDKLARELDEATAAAGAATSASVTLAAAEARVASAAASLAVAHDKVAAAADKDAAAQNRAAASLASAQARVAAATAALNREQTKSTAASNDNAAALNRQAFGARNMGQQVGDFFTQVSLGGGVLRAFSSQIGQVGFAASEMGGKIGAVGRFLTGPWGIALTVATLLLSPFVEKLFEAGDAAKEQADKLDAAAAAADSYGNAQSLLGKIIDLTTGKLKTQNAVLIQTIKLQAQANILAAQSAQKAGLDTIKGAQSPSIAEGVKAAGSNLLSTFLSGGSEVGKGGRALSKGLAPLRADLEAYRKEAEAYQRVLNDPKAGTAAVAAASDRFNKSLDGTLTKLSASAKGAGRDVIKTKQDVLALGAALNDQRANQQVVDVVNGGPLPDELKPYKTPGKPKKPKKPPKPKSTEARDEFGRDAADTIGNVLAQFDGTPTLVREVNNQVAKLDDLIDDLRRKKPPGFEKLIDDARTAQDAVRNGLNKPYEDFIAEQQRSIENSRLIASGHADEAQALQIVYGLEKQMGPLSQARKDAILATVQAMKAEERQAQILIEKQQKYLTAIGDIKAAVRGVIFDGLDGLEDLPKRLIGAFGKLRSEEIFENLFGDVFRELEDQVKGTTVVEDASARMSEAIDGTLNPLAELAAAASKTAGALGGAAGGPSVVPPSGGLAGAAASVVGGGSVAGAVAAVLAGQKVGGLGVPGLPGGAANDNSGDEIVVNGRKRQSAQGLFGDALGKIAKGVGISDEAAKKIGTIGGKAIAGAATGAAVNSVLKPLGKALGVKTSQTGAQIGGAIGSFIPIPGGDIIGSVIGSVVGGLFKKTKSGSATIGNVGGEGAVTGTGGNSSSYKKAASGLADSVIGSLDNVVEALGGTLGDFSVSIGKRKKKFVVDSSGSGKTKGGGTVKFDSEEEAIAAALADAIKDGAVAGISAAMQRALKSTTDVDKAVKEALKVKAVEELIEGVGGTLQKTFRDFDKQAAEYVTTAQKYGLDVIAVEKATAEKRTELIAAALDDQIGSLKDFLDNLKYGDLAEGSPLDQRKILLDKIASVQADAEAGKAGAADQLAQLYQKLLTSDKDTFGTAGPEYANDRATAEANVQKVIAMAEKRVNDAATSTTDTVAAINQGNTLANENNALMAQLVAGVNGLPASIAAAILSGSYGGAANLNATARQAVA